MVNEPQESCAHEWLSPRLRNIGSFPGISANHHPHVEASPFFPPRSRECLRAREQDSRAPNDEWPNAAEAVKSGHSSPVPDPHLIRHCGFCQPTGVLPVLKPPMLRRTITLSLRACWQLARSSTTTAKAPSSASQSTHTRRANAHDSHPRACKSQRQDSIGSAPSKRSCRHKLGQFKPDLIRSSHAVEMYAMILPPIRTASALAFNVTVEPLNRLRQYVENRGASMRRQSGDSFA